MAPRAQPKAILSVAEAECVAPGMAFLSQEGPGVHFLDLCPGVRVRRAVGDIKVPRAAIPERKCGNLPRQPLEYKPRLHDLATRIDSLLGQFRLGLGLSQDLRAIRWPSAGPG